MTQPSTIQIDVRELPPRERHVTIFSTFGQLAVGQALELINDHDPRPLYAHFQADRPGQFAWDYLERGPHTWRVAITKLQPSPNHGQCCGSCGGA
ncbi:DUF2249 domain-containing protein [Ralstonia syzygii subsp. celebesensis]|uniref:Aminotransferase n=3 Tax=Ralstonia syzygii TaxID=28097 RepID=A0A1U9VGS6_9RALS|nr:MULTISPECIES: DUF2249 domain-containing protein [Ralstonia solanacearum species complex]CCA80340.1 conserved hypothethical protein, SirA-like [blood disease bacterium R229]BEU73470.1 DUF2249 domain-containing protein [Ralstonia pseudosolanacearum]AMP38843.1 aminotransferase [Ralstonia solanacearum]AQW29888.1 aminotransferase [blood disease bacterium A2-HR MARDI]AXV78253.1 DUF2249 domain-containing protein [Ralstonia solanacearum]